MSFQKIIMIIIEIRVPNLQRNYGILHIAVYILYFISFEPYFVTGPLVPDLLCSVGVGQFHPLGQVPGHSNHWYYGTHLYSKRQNMMTNVLEESCDLLMTLFH